MHVVMHGRGLKLFQDPKYIGHDLRKPTWPPSEQPEAKPWLGLCQVQCNGVLAPTNYLMFEQGLRLTNIGDPNHAAQRVLWTSARETGMWKVIRMTQISLNCMVAPFASHGHHAKCIDVAGDYGRSATPHCALLQSVLPDCAIEMGRPDAIHDEQFADEVLQEFQSREFVKTKHGNCTDPMGQLV